MAAPFATSAGHWYQIDGTPYYTIKGANGVERNTTLADARRLNLLPSVTTIIACAARPGLERWKSEQVLLAALTLPRQPDEPESDWLERVRLDAREQAAKAAELGQTIHGALERDARGEPFDPAYAEHVRGAREAIRQWCGAQQWRAERSFAHPLGYGGKVDLHSTELVVDYKTKAFSAADLPKTWDEHIMQLAAYRRGLQVPEARCAIVFVSTTVPGLATLRELAESELDRGLRMFDALLAYHQHSTGHRPCF